MVKKYKIGSYRKLPKYQSGVVLIVSLVFLVALTAVAAALMQNTTTDMKMSGASQEKSLALQETLSEMDRVIYNEVNRVNANGAGNNINRFAQTAESYSNPINLTVTKPSITVGALSNYNVHNLDIGCPRQLRASSDAKCNYLRVTINRQYGRNNNSNIQVNAGIAQKLL